MVWTTLVLVAVMIGAGGYYLYDRRTKYDPTTDAYKTNLYAAYTCFGLLGLYILCMLCCCNRIRLAIAIMEATAEFVRKNLRIFFLPFMSFFVIVAFFAWWIVTALFVYSVGSIEKGSSDFFPNIKWD
jgi:hypothetical protein